MEKLWFGVLFLFVFTLLGCSTSPELKSDLLLYNGKIWTGDSLRPWAEWIAIRGDKIIDIGSGKRPRADSAIDLNGQLTVPGFNDSHVHFASAGALLLGLNLLDVNSEDALINKVREATKRLPEGSWITRGDWGAYEAWAEGSEGKTINQIEFLPHRSMIDSLTPNHPVLINRYDRTIGLANRVALQHLGVETESGLLEGEQFLNAIKQIPEKTFARRVAESQRALEEIRKWGITTVQDMSPLDQVEVYHYLRDQAALTCRINFSPARLIEYKNMVKKGWVINSHHLSEPRPSGDEWISFGTIKTHIDGIMGARTARFFQPYSDNILEDSQWRGGWREFSENMPSFKEMLLSADDAGIQLRVHAIGDQANSILLDILDTLDQVNGPKDRRFRLVHAQVIAPEDFPRFRGRNIVAEVQPYHITDDMRWMEDRIGRERCKGAYAFKTLMDHGCILSFGSDWPGTNASYYPVNPLKGIYAAVTRQTILGAPEDGWFPDEKVTLEQALKAYTWGAAYGAFEERYKGTLSVGKLADITVIDTDLFTTEAPEWLQAEIQYTIVGGRIVYANRPGSKG